MTPRPRCAVRALREGEEAMVSLHTEFDPTGTQLLDLVVSIRSLAWEVADERIVVRKPNAAVTSDQTPTYAITPSSAEPRDRDR